MNYEDYVDPFIDEVAKYKKRSSKTKTKRSNHKHIYKKYIGVLAGENNKHFPVVECIICGRVESCGFWFSKKTDDGFYTSINGLENVKQFNPELEVKVYDKFPW